MIILEEVVNIQEKRIEEVYVYLVDETENPATLTSLRKNELLGKLLSLMEYLRGGEDDENPVPDWFE